MPIREYRCQKCESKFETLLLQGEDEATVDCPKCQATEVRRCMSVFIGLVPNGGTSAAASKATAGGGGACGSCSSGSCANCH